MDEAACAPEDKAAWRRWAKANRPDPLPEPRPLVEALATLLFRCPPGWIVTYRPLPHELDLSMLERLVPHRGFALTRTPSTGRDLTLHSVAGPLERHRWGFHQPSAGAPEVAPGDVAAVLVPGLVFDRRGNRLGHGVGYYDRLLARVPVGAWRVGITPAALVVDALPVDDHDVAMTHLATELGVTACRG